MGRSQVEYNRKHGRPGGRGKNAAGAGGRGGRGSSSNRRHVVAGDNSWRYAKDNDGREQHDEQSNLMLVEEHHHDLNVMSGGSYVHHTEFDLAIDGTTTTEQDWDIVAMSAALKTIPVHERLGVPMYLFDSLRGAIVTDDSGKEYSLNQTDQDEVAGSTISEKEETEGTTNQSDIDDEDDMEAWLDSVIS